MLLICGCIPKNFLRLIVDLGTMRKFKYCVVKNQSWKYYRKYEMKGNNITTTSKIQFFDATQYKPGFIFLNCKVLYEGRNLPFFSKFWNSFVKGTKKEISLYLYKKIEFYPILNLL